MQQFYNVNALRLAYGGILGATSGVMLVTVMLALNTFGFGSLMQQTANPLGHLSLMLIKPVLFFGGVGMALSMWRQPQRDA
jgi:hypothetical protein